MLKWLEQYFTFTKSERQAVIALIILSVIILLAPQVYFFLKPARVLDSSKYQKELDNFASAYHKEEDENQSESEEDSSLKNKAVVASTTTSDTAKHFTRKTYTNAPYFQFDPNKIGINEWMRLGFTEKQAITIEKYKAHGGKFYKPTDLKRLYVMTDEHYAKLEPFVKIDVDALPKREYRNRNNN
jgi:hypothetical protein